MIPKLKAIELVDRMRLTYEQTSDYVYESTAIECALIAVDEIIEEVREFCDDNFINDRLHYWQEVKTELIKLR